MDPQATFKQVLEQLPAIAAARNPQEIAAWDSFIKLHPSDIAQCLATVDAETFGVLFLLLEQRLKLDVFLRVSDMLKVQILGLVNEDDLSFILTNSPFDELADVFLHLSDKEAKHYLSLLYKHDREHVRKLMKFGPETAGGIMDTHVFALSVNFTVERSINLLRRLRALQEVHQVIFVVDERNKLRGYIQLQDLIIEDPDTKLVEILKESTLMVDATEDQEDVARMMVRYQLKVVPVVDEKKHFLGIVTSETLEQVLTQEAKEDIYKMSAMVPTTKTYFDTSFWRMLYERSSILIILLLAQTFSSIIIKNYEALLAGFLTYFITMLISTGGNVSSQTSAVAIQGMASGEIHKGNLRRFLRREFLMAVGIAIIVGVFGFLRVYITDGFFWGSVAVSFSLAAIVLVSVVLGSTLPLVLKKLNLDPAFSAGPGLATLMDIMGLLIYCSVSSFVLGRLL